MATILPFSEISNHLSVKPDQRKVLIDTCALIAYSHGASEFSDETEELFIKLRQNSFTAFTNVNIRSEFLDYQRRLIVTEALTNIASQVKGLNSFSAIQKRLKSHIALVHKRASEGKPLVLNDSEIKRFKKLLSINYSGIPNIWLKFCDNNLKDSLQRTFDLLEKVMKLKYLSVRKGEKSPEVNGDVSWERMIELSETSALGVNDSMILNMFESTSIPYLVTTDFDVVYSGAISNNTQIIFCPNRIYQDYKENYFHLL